MELYYEMDNEMAKTYDSFSTHFACFKASKRKWQYLHAQQNYDWKRNAGAGKLINRVGIAGVDMHQVPVKFFKTNVQIRTLSFETRICSFYRNGYWSEGGINLLRYFIKIWSLIIVRLSLSRMRRWLLMPGL